MTKVAPNPKEFISDNLKPVNKNDEINDFLVKYQIGFLLLPSTEQLIKQLQKLGYKTISRQSVHEKAKEIMKGEKK